MKRKFIIILFRLYAAAASSAKMSTKKIMDGRFNRFLSAVNVVLHTPQELYTHHYVYLDVLPCDSLQQVLLYTIVEMLTIMCNIYD
jgi:hypothetical protein